MKTWLGGFFTTIAVVTAAASAQGNVARGELKAATDCAACHGADGNSETPAWPKLAGIDERYTVAQLGAYQAGQRQDPVMGPLAKGLIEEDMHDLGAFYASKKMSISTAAEADKALHARGERIYTVGDPGKVVTACAVCHGREGNGHPSAGFPRLGGQHALYVATTMQAFRTGQRPDPDGMMRQIAEGMSDEEIEAVASYINGLSVGQEIVPGAVH